MPRDDSRLHPDDDQPDRERRRRAGRLQSRFPLPPGLESLPQHHLLVLGKMDQTKTASRDPNHRARPGGQFAVTLRLGRSIHSCVFDFCDMSSWTYTPHGSGQRVHARKTTRPIPLVHRRDVLVEGVCFSIRYRSRINHKEYGQASYAREVRNTLPRFDWFNCPPKQCTREIGV